MGGGIENRAALVLDGNTVEQSPRQGGLDGTVEGHLRPVLEHDVKDGSVDDHTERFHQIVGKAEGVVAVVVADAEGGFSAL